VFVLGGCSPEHYKAEADKEVYDIINSKWKDNFGQKANYTISDVAPSPDDIQVDKVVPQSRVFSLAQAVALATAQNRDYQTQKETLYRNALSLTGIRHQYALRWFGTIEGTYVDDKRDTGYDDVSVNASGRVSKQQLLLNGVLFSTEITLDWMRFLTGDPRTTLGSVLTGDFTVPLLGAGAGKVAREQLTQAERNVLYQIRTFNRSRQTFVVDIIDRYYRVLQARDQVTNAENDYKSRVDSRQRVEMEAQAGRKPPFEVDQARQSELTARDNLLRAQQGYERQLDDFKLELSLPTDAEIVLDQNELDVLREIGVTEPDYTLDEAVETALAQRMDLANTRDRVEDAARNLELAADGLGVQLDLVGTARVDSTPETDFTRLRFHEGIYTLGLQADMPFDRKAERNAYREALIALTQWQREYDNAVDTVKLNVRDAYRRLLEEAESYRTQQVSLELSKERVQSTTMLLQAGRVTTRDWLESQDALLRAQNSLTSALIAHAVTKLSFFRDIGILQVRPDGMAEQWETGRPAEPQEPPAEPGKAPTESATEQLVELDNSSTQANGTVQEFAGPRQASSEPSRRVDFRDFLAQPERIWDK
jgi:outer membrane protein TolC